MKKKRHFKKDGGITIPTSPLDELYEMLMLTEAEQEILKQIKHMLVCTKRTIILP